MNKLLVVNARVLLATRRGSSPGYISLSSVSYLSPLFITVLSISVV